MDYIQGLDVSRYQGQIDWNAVKSAGYEIAIIKVSGSDIGDYVDPRAGINYAAARNAGMAFGTYHFAGGTDPIHEAEFFVSVCSPLDENQVLVLDWEVQHNDPVAWVNTFTNHVHDLTGIWPIVYMNGSTRNAYDWSPVAQNCGFWIAWYGRDPEVVLPVQGSYVAHQYTSTGSVPGISGNVDLDAWFIDVSTFNKYGYHAAAPMPTPPPEPTPAPVPDPVPVPPVASPPVLMPTPQPIPKPKPPVSAPALSEPWYKTLLRGILALFGIRLK